MTVAQPIRREIYDEDSDKAHVVLIRVTHPSLAEPIQLCTGNPVLLSDDPERFGVVSGGQTYEFIMASITLPDDRHRQLPVARMSFDNFAGLVEELQSFTWPPAKVSLAVVFADAPDFVIKSWIDFSVTQASFNASTVTLSLQYRKQSGRQWGVRMNQHRFPCLFW